MSWSFLIAVAIALKSWLKPVHVLLGYPVISTIATIAFMNASSTPMTILCAFIIGFSLAGVMQLALSVICEFFWKNKGRMTGIFCTATSAASAGIPFVTGMITRIADVQGVFVFSLIINVTGIVFASIVNIRYRKLTKTVDTTNVIAA